MDLTHEFTVPADIDTAWAIFMDLDRVGSCFPGATVTEFSDDNFSGTVKVKLGIIALQYAGSGSFLERDPDAKRAVIEAKGKDKRGNGTAGATVTLQLTPDGDGTRVDVRSELQITGKPAQFGRGVMQDVSDKLRQQVGSCIEGEVAEPEPEAPAEAAAGPEVPDAAPVDAPAPPTGTPPIAAKAPAPAATPTRSARRDDDGDAIDLGATVLPVLAKTYAPHLIAALIAFLVGYRLGRRRR